MSFYFKSQGQRRLRFASRLSALPVLLNCGFAVTVSSAQAQQPTPNKPKTETKTTPPVKPAVSQGAKKPDVLTTPLKPVEGPFGTARSGGVGPLAIPAGPKLTAEEWEKKGREAMGARKFEDAIVAFKEATQLKSSTPSAWFGLGAAYEAKRQWPEAAQAFRKLTELTPTSGQSYALLSNALLQANQNEAALHALDRAIELNPNASELIIQQGSVYLQQKDTRRAERAFLQALGSAPDSPAAHVGMGDVYAQEGRQMAALEEYDAAARIDAAYIPAKLGRATALAASGRLKMAEDLLTKLSSELEVIGLQLKAKANGVGADARTTAQTQAQLGQLALQQANVLSTVAQILDTPMRREDAIKAYQAALKITPDNATLWGNLGWTQYEAAQYEAAIQNSRKALELDGSLAYVRLNLGLLYAVQNNWTEAQKEYRQAVAVSTPTDIEAGIKDVRDAQSKPSAVPALQQALTFLSLALEKAIRTQAKSELP